MANQKECIEAALLGMAVRNDGMMLLRRKRGAGQKYQLPIIRHSGSGNMALYHALGLDSDANIREFGSVAAEQEDGTTSISKLLLISLESCPQLMFRAEEEDMLLLKLRAEMFGSYIPLPLSDEAKSAIDVYTFALGADPEQLTFSKKAA